VTINTLTIKNQNKNMVYMMSEGGYAIENGLLTVSIQTEKINEDDYPDCAYLCITNIPISAVISPGNIFQAESPSDGLKEDETLIENGRLSPAAYGYFGFHSESIAIKVSIKECIDDSLIIEIEADHDDVDYYDERAHRSSTFGKFKVDKCSREKLWVPIW
jgi:hypothetical protein